MKYENKFGREVPASYVSFLNENPNECYIDFRVATEYEYETKIFGDAELTEIFEMNSIGSASNFEYLKVYIKFQRDIGFTDVDAPDLKEEEMKRVENGLVFGLGENFGGYGCLYLDALANHSV